MTKQRTTHTLLAVVVALLGLHLALRLSPPKAVAQEPQVWPPPPMEIIQISAVAYDGDYPVHRIYRLWSDGTIEYSQGYFTPRQSGWSNWRIVPDP